MSLEPYEQSPAEMETEFGVYPEEIRRAALEYARGLQASAQGELDQEDPAQFGGEVPDFIMVGLRGGTILASTALTCSQFIRKQAGFDRLSLRPGGPVARVPRWSILLGVEMTSFDQHNGADYASALNTLLGEWARKKKARERADEVPRQLEGGGGQ